MWRRLVRSGGIIRGVVLVPADFLGLGHSHSSFGITLALAITFVVAVGGIAQLLIGYAVVSVMAERRQNRERAAAYDRGERPVS